MTTTNNLGIPPTVHTIPVGTGTGFSTISPTSAISGNPFVSNGSSSDPSFSNTASVNQITIVNSPVNPSDGVNKNYADLISAGFTIKASTEAATTANLTATYSNGTAGVGATLTNSGAQAAFAVDGYTASVNDRILVKNQTSSANNGIYSVTTLGSGSTNWVLTRTTDYNTVAEIVPGSMVPVINGTVNAGTFWTETNTVTTIGTSPIAFNSFGVNASQFLQVANNLSDVASVATSRSNLGLTNVATQNVTQYAVLVGGAANAITSVGAAGTTGQILQANTGANPSYSTAKYPSTTTASQLLYSSAANSVTGLATANDGVLITSNTGVPSWLAAGTTGQMLTATTGSPASWSTATYPQTTTVSQLLYSSATNTVSGLTTANDGVLITSNTGVPSWLGNSATPGYVLTANTAAPPSWQVAPGANGPLGFAKATSSAQISTTKYLPATGTTPTTANTDLLISLTYTPKSATSTLIFEVSYHGSGGTQYAFLFQGTTFINASTTEGYLYYSMTSGTTSSTTYNIYYVCGQNFVTNYINSINGTNAFNSATSLQTTFTITEYA